MSNIAQEANPVVGINEIDKLKMIIESNNALAYTFTSPLSPSKMPPIGEATFFYNKSPGEYFKEESSERYKIEAKSERVKA
jgi:hypothetical protein